MQIRSSPPAKRISLKEVNRDFSTGSEDSDSRGTDGQTPRSAGQGSNSLHGTACGPLHAAHKSDGEAGHFHGFYVVTEGRIEGSAFPVVNRPEHGFVLACWVHVEVWHFAARGRGCRTLATRV